MWILQERCATSVGGHFEAASFIYPLQNGRAMSTPKLNPQATEDLREKYWGNLIFFLQFLLYLPFGHPWRNTFSTEQILKQNCRI